MKIQILLSLIRYKHWLKNIILISPIFFAGKIDKINQHEILILIATFISFCLTSSTVYILNDIQDVEHDRLHIEKCKRPIASGAVSLKQAYFAIAIIAIFNSIILINLKFNITLIIISYFVLNLVYIYFAKNFSIIDVCFISIGFVLRIFAGGNATEVFISHWIVIMIFLLMLSVGLAKRKDDLLLNNDGNKLYRKSQKGYSKEFIDIAITFIFSITMMSYILYSVDANTIEKFKNKYIYFTCLPVLVGILYYLQLTIVKGQTGSPVKLLFSDRLLQGIILVWALMFYLIIYV